MSVVIETTLGDITVDLFLEHRPRTCLNFLKLCKLKFYNYNLFHTIQHEFIAQTGDPTGSGHSGTSVWGVIEGAHKRYFEAESLPKIRHTETGLISMVSSGDNLIGSQFFFTLGSDLLSLDEKHCVFGEVVEGFDVLRLLNEVICDDKSRPFKDVRITHTVVLDDPFENPRGFREPSRSPSPTAERLQGGRIAADEEIDDMAGKTEEEINEMLQNQEAKARATILEIVGDLPDADIAPPENVLFVCKLNPVTTDDDLEIIFSRFGKIKGCEVIRDRKTGDSLQYAFVEFEEQKSCEDAYFKMDNVLIDDRRIHVDFSQSVSKIRWTGKGRELLHFNEKSGKYTKDNKRSNKIDFKGRDFNNQKRNPQFGNRQSRSPRRRDYSPQRRRPSPQRRRSRSRENSNRNNHPKSRSPRRRSNSPSQNRSRVQDRRRGDHRRKNYEDKSRDDDRRREDNRRRDDDRREDRNERHRMEARREERSKSRRRSPEISRSRGSRDNRRPPERRPLNEEVIARKRSSSRERVVEKKQHQKSSERPQKRPKKRSSSSSSETSSSSGDDDSSPRSRKKRNKTKKSKKSRTSSDSSDSSESEDSRRHKKKRKSKKKKHKKSNK